MADPKQEFDLSKIHRANLEILTEIDRICRKYGITYLLDSGTLLGAVRHKGFIPWDDDVDLVFRREEYERFMVAADAEMSDKLELIRPDEYRGGKAFYDFTPRVIYKNSRRHSADDKDQQFYEGKLNHLWVDLFILDRLPDSAFGSEMMKLEQKIVYGMAMAHRRTIDFSKYPGISKLQVRVLSSIGKLIPMPLLFKLQDYLAGRVTRQCQKTGRYTGKSWFSNYQPDFQYCTVPNSWEEPVTEFSFEGKLFTGPQKWDYVLHMLYGDYMKLPKEQDRVPSHSGMEIEVLD